MGGSTRWDRSSADTAAAFPRDIEGPRNGGVEQIEK